MNPIELTQEHISKLLEMCKVLFPELQKEAYSNTVEYYGNEKIADLNFGGFYITGNNFIQCSYPINESDDSFHEHLIKPIHWFEFCMTHLSTKIFNKLTDFSNHMTTDYEQEASYEWDAELMQRCSFFIANPTRMIDKHPDGKVVAWHPVDYLYEEFKKIKQ